MRIIDIAGELGRGTLFIRGRALACRALSAAEDAWIGRVYPRPVAPRVRDTSPGRGSLATKPDTGDPAFRQAMVDWDARVSCLELAVACGLEDAAGEAFDPRWPAAEPESDEARRAERWARGVAAEVAGALTTAELERAVDQRREMEAGVVARAYARLHGVDVADLSDEEARACTVDVSAGANTLRLAAELAERYRPHDLAAWWDRMPIGERGLLVALEVDRRLRESA